jgi:hypothetical protein
MEAVHNISQVEGGLLPGSVMNKYTIDMVISQSVSYQYSYPTEPYAGKFCLPTQAANSALRAQIIDGPFMMSYGSGQAFGTLRRAWPLLIGVALLIVVLGYCYLWMLKFCAGILLLSVMALSVIFVLITSVFFLVAVFVSPTDTSGFYQKYNPVYRTYIGMDAKMNSVLIGVVLMILGISLGVLISRSYENIDEVVGIVQASCECLRDEATLRLVPLVQAGVFLSLILAFMALGLPYVAALGYLDKANIDANGVPVEGLQRVFRRSYWDTICLAYYLFGCWWIAEFFISFGQFVVSYAVCLWYFQPVQEVPQDAVSEELMKAAEGGGRRIKEVQVRIGGLNEARRNHLPRPGMVTKFGENKYLVVPVEEREEYFDFEDDEASDFIKEPIPCAAITGFCVALWYHSGSIALGCLCIAVTRPFRMMSGCISGFSRPDPEDAEDEFDKLVFEDCCRDVVKSCCHWLTMGKYLAICLDYLFGGYSKNAFTEIALSGCTFTEAAERSRGFIMESAGTVARHQNACFIYEVFGTFFMSVVGVVSFVLIADNVDAFSQQSSAWYIPNLYWGSFWAAVVSATTAFEFMQIFNHTGDTLLYAFAWNRELASSQESKKDKEEFHPERFCPGALRDMMEEFELEPEEELKSEGQSPMALLLRAGYGMRPFPEDEREKKRYFPSGMTAASGWSSHTSSGMSRMRKERSESSVSGRSARELI